MSISRQKSSHYDVIVIGAGASGLFAAGRAGALGKRVLVLEKNKEVGKKLSITGGGRCNITNAEYDTRVLLSHYGDAAKFLFSPFSQFGVSDTFSFFEERGMPFIVEEGKRAFPKVESAPAVVSLLKKYMCEYDVTLKLGYPVRGFVSEGVKIVGVQTQKEVFYADSFVLATGGASHKDTGSTGEGLTWLQALGHTVHAPNPDIVPLNVSTPWVKTLKGTTLKKMKITFAPGTPDSFSKVGRLLFTHFGLSGPLILNSAHRVKGLLRRGVVSAHIDLYPDIELGALRTHLLTIFEESKNKDFKNTLKKVVPPKMAHALLALLPQVLTEKKVHSITQKERYELASLLKALPLEVIGTMGYEWAVVSDGGVDLREIDTKTMASKIHKNLYFTGDVLNIRRPSGGYSLQLCWTTGWVAGSSV